MGLQLLNIENSDKTILNKYRRLPIAYKKILHKKLDELFEKMEDEQDLKDARERMKEKSTPANKVYKKLGLL